MNSNQDAFVPKTNCIYLLFSSFKFCSDFQFWFYYKSSVLFLRFQNNFLQVFKLHKSHEVKLLTFLLSLKGKVTCTCFKIFRFSSKEWDIIQIYFYGIEIMTQQLKNANSSCNGSGFSS